MIQFEAHSRKLALEWIKRLRELVKYWTRRHRVDARQEMELQRAASGDLRADPKQIERYGDGFIPDLFTDPEDVSQYLGSFWNWSILLARRSLIRCGRVFFRKGIRGPFKLMLMCLVAGHAVFFHIKSGNQFNAYHRSRTVNLLDAYVISGRAAVESIASSDDDTHFARRYQDGLECNDSVQDTLFIIWCTKLRTDYGMGATSENVAAPPPPNLNAKRKVIVLKTRSKLERDAWCWAINMELERLARVHADREDAARNAGGVAEIRR